jgi:outer membrane receptor for ferrienterochelin and colicins
MAAAPAPELLRVGRHAAQRPGHRVARRQFQSDARPHHQYHGFGYFEDILDETNRLSLISARSNGKFQIPNQRGLQPSLGLTSMARPATPARTLEREPARAHQLRDPELAALAGRARLADLGDRRYSSLTFTPDALGDLLYNGIAQSPTSANVAYRAADDAAYKLNDDRAHARAPGCSCSTRCHQSHRLAGAAHRCAGNQTSDMPESIADNGARPSGSRACTCRTNGSVLADLTINYGLRVRQLHAYSPAAASSARASTSCGRRSGTTVHAGYSRYFSPPPFELVGGETIAKFANTTAAAGRRAATTRRWPSAPTTSMSACSRNCRGRVDGSGVDTYYKRSQNLIDEGQFGAPIILTPFNYAQGQAVRRRVHRQLRPSATSPPTATSRSRAPRARTSNRRSSTSRRPNSAYIADNYIHLDHEQRVTASAGASYLWDGTRFSADMLLGTGLRADLRRAGRWQQHSQRRAPADLHAGQPRREPRFQLGSAGDVTLRLDVDQRVRPPSTRSATAPASASGHRSSDRGAASSAYAQGSREVATECASSRLSRISGPASARRLRPRIKYTC